MTTRTDGPGPARDDGTVDYTAISGVGSKISTALNEAGISSMELLAAMTVGQVVSALEDVDVHISAGKIVSQLWLQQAWMLSEVSDEFAGQDVQDASGTVDQETDSEETNEAGNWREQFGLFIYLDQSLDGQRWRTRIWDTTDLIEQKLPGVAPGLAVDLIIDRTSPPS